VGRPANGPSRGLAGHRADQLKALANANPPQVPEAIGRAILETMK
jgi:hypothetical protein